MKFNNKEKLVALATFLGVARATTYYLMKNIYSKSLDKLELDFGNDIVLSIVFKKDE